MNLSIVKPMGLAVLLGLLPVVALAAPPQGQWRGIIQQANSDVAVAVSFNSQVAKVHFAEPFSCDVPAKLLKLSDTTTIYRFSVSTNGGRFCDQLAGRDLTVTPASNGSLTIAFAAPKSFWRGELKQMPTP